MFPRNRKPCLEVPDSMKQKPRFGPPIDYYAEALKERELKNAIARNHQFAREAISSESDPDIESNYSDCGPENKGRGGGTVFLTEENLKYLPNEDAVEDENKKVKDWLLKVSQCGDELEILDLEMESMVEDMEDPELPESYKLLDKEVQINVYKESEFKKVHPRLDVLKRVRNNQTQAHLDSKDDAPYPITNTSKTDGFTKYKEEEDPEDDALEIGIEDLHVNPSEEVGLITVEEERPGPDLPKLENVDPKPVDLTKREQENPKTDLPVTKPFQSQNLFTGNNARLAFKERERKFLRAQRVRANLEKAPVKPKTYLDSIPIPIPMKPKNCDQEEPQARMMSGRLKNILAWDNLGGIGTWDFPLKRYKKVEIKGDPNFHLDLERAIKDGIVPSCV